MAAGFKTATVQGGQVSGSSHSNFPVFVDLSRLGITTLAEAQSVRVYADSGKVTEWAREIVSVVEMHVKVPSLSSSTEIYIDWDGVRSDYGNGDTYGRNAVWTDNYLAVYHFENATTLTDSTGNGADASIEMGGATLESGGELGQNVVRFNGNDSYTQTAVLMDGLSNFTIRSIVKISSTASTNRAIAFYGNVYTSGYKVAWGHDVIGDKVSSSLYKNATPDRIENDGATNYGTTNFLWYANVWDPSAGNLKNYVDTTVDSNTTNATVTSMVTLSSTYQKLYIGRYENSFGDRYFTGDMDEIRIQESELSSDYLTTEHNNQSDESAFWGTWSDVSAGYTPTPIVHMMQMAGAAV